MRTEEREEGRGEEGEAGHTKTRYLNPSISDIRNLYGLITSAAAEREMQTIRVKRTTTETYADLYRELVCIVTPHTHLLFPTLTPPPLPTLIPHPHSLPHSHSLPHPVIHKQPMPSPHTHTDTHIHTHIPPSPFSLSSSMGSLSSSPGHTNVSAVPYSKPRAVLPRMNVTCGEGPSLTY